MATHEQNEFFAHFADSAALCRLAKYFSVLGGLNADCRLCDTQSPRATTICRGCTAADLIRDIGGILLLVPSGDLRHKRLYSTGKFGLQWGLGGRSGAGTSVADCVEWAIDLAGGKII